MRGALRGASVVRRVRLAAALALLAATAPGCSGGASPDPEAGPPAAEDEVTLPSRQEFVDRGLAIEAEDRAALRAEFGEPVRVVEEVIPNRHVPGVLDTIFTLYYPQFVARIHHPGGGGDLLSMVQVESNEHLRFPLLGLDVQDVDAAFGRPDEASDSSLTYYCTTCEAGDDPVEIVFQDGEARRVRFNYYVD